MHELYWEEKSWGTWQDPIAAHISYLRHLSKPGTAKLVLRDRFGFSADNARKTAQQVAAYVERAIEFWEAAKSTPYSVRSVPQYYCYLNLAVATVLVYRPMNYLEHRRHGVHDLSSRLHHVDLNSRIVTISRQHGAIPLFHSVISLNNIRGRTFRLRDLLVPLNCVSAELIEAFNVDLGHIRVHVRVDNPATHHGIAVTLRFIVASELANKTWTLPIRRLENNLALLGEFHRSPEKGSYTWKLHLEKPNSLADIFRFRKRLLPLINPGVYYPTSVNYPGSVVGHWCISRKGPILPMLTSALVTAFALSSLARYRPLLSRRAEGSRLNLLFDTFVREGDGIVIPAMRNLLFNETARIHQAPA